MLKIESTVDIHRKKKKLYIYLPTVHHRGRTQECSKALVVLLSFYCLNYALYLCFVYK